MKALVVGKGSTKFEGNTYYKVCVTYKAPLPTETSKFERKCTDRLSIQAEYFDLIDVGKEYFFDFDKQGKLLDFELVGE